MTIYQTVEQLWSHQENMIALDLLWETHSLANKHNPDAIFQLVQHYNAREEWLKAVIPKELIANAPANVTYRAFLADFMRPKVR